MAISCIASFVACSREDRAERSRESAPPRADEGDVELWLGGDVHLGSRTKRLFSGRIAALEGAAGIVNLEGPVTSRDEPSSETRLVSWEARLAALREAGVRVAGIANNHALDVGADGPRATADAIRRAGMVAAGGPAGDAAIQVAGRRVGVVAIDLSDGVPTDLRVHLQRVHRAVDVLVVSAHVTAPSTYLPVRELRIAVDIAARVGARVVVAHGSHTYGAIERKEDAVIAWGLGNLVFDCDCSREDDGLLLRVSIPRTGGSRARIVPIDAGLGGAAARPARDAERVLDVLAAIGGARVRREGGVGWF